MSYRIGPDCSTCHYCFNECPVHAIRFVGSQYAIDPAKCISCGKCARVCPTGRITNPGRPTVPTLHPTNEYHADAVILGAGGAGLVAAVRFAQMTGGKVIVLEKAEKVGGSTTLGHAFCTRYTKLHREAGMPDEREQALDVICSDAQPGYPRALLRRAMYGLDDMFDWLCTFGGCEEEFQLTDLRGGPQMGPFPHMPGLLGPRKRFRNVHSADDSMGPGWAGTFVVEKMMEQTKKLGIRVLTQHRAQHLAVDSSGSFRAVYAADPGGTTIVYAKTCLIATGGFSRNRALMNQIRPTFYEGRPCHSFAAASNTGDAIAMVQEIDGQLDLDTVKIPMFSPSHHPFTFSLVRLTEDPRMLQVNRDGARFADESAHLPGVMGTLEDQPDHYAWAICDADGLEVMGHALEERCRGSELAEIMGNWRADAEYECTLDLAAQKADTIEALADLLHTDSAALARTVSTYNSGCASGEDAFGKSPDLLLPIRKPPFYAFYLGRFNEGAVGGIVNDDRLRLLDQNNRPFRGLYLAGDCCRGVLKKNDDRSKFGEMPWAMASGWLAAEEMAAFCAEDSSAG